MTKSKIFNLFCAGVIVISTLVPVSAASVPSASTSLSNQEMSQIKALQSEMQNTMKVTNQANQIDASDLSNKVNKIGLNKAETLAKKYISLANGKASINDKSFLKLSKDEQSAVIAYYFKNIQTTSQKVTYLNTYTNQNVATSGKVSAMALAYSAQFSCKTAVSSIGAGFWGVTLARVESGYNWCYYLNDRVTNAWPADSYPRKYSYTSLTVWQPDTVSPRCDKIGNAMYECYAIYGVQAGLILYNNGIYRFVYIRHTFNLWSNGSSSVYAYYQ